MLPVALWTGSTSFEPLKFTLWATAVATWLAFDGRKLASRAGLAAVPWGARAALALGLAAVASCFQGCANSSLAWRTAALCGLAAAVATAVATTPLRHRASYGWGLQVGGLLTGIVALLQTAGALPGIGPETLMARGIGTLGNPNYVAGFAAVLVWPAFGLVVGAPGRLRSVALLCLAVQGAVLATAHATGPAAAVAGSGLVMLPAFLARWRGHMAMGTRLAVGGLVAAVLAGGAFGLAGGLGLPGIDRLPVMVANDGDLRTATWAAALGMSDSAPVSGVGAGNFPIAWPAIRPRLDLDTQPAPIATRAHNETLQWIAETGSVGALVLLLVLAACAMAWQRPGHSGSPAAGSALASMAGLCALAIHGAVSFPLHLPATGLAAAVFLGQLGPDSAPPPHRTRPWVSAALLALALGLVGGAWREFAADLDCARGRRDLRAGNPRGALAHLDAAIGRSCWPGPARLHRAQAWRAVGNADAARRDLQDSLRDKPTYEAMVLLAENDIECGDHVAAAARLQQTEMCRPPYRIRLEITYLRAYGALRRGSDDEAERLLAGLLALDPNNPRAHLALGYLDVRAERIEEGAAHYRAAVTAIEYLLADPGHASETAGLRGLLGVAERALLTLPSHPALGTNGLPR